MDADPPPAMRDLLLPDLANPMIPPTAKKNNTKKVPFKTTTTLQTKKPPANWNGKLS